MSDDCERCEELGEALRAANRDARESHEKIHALSSKLEACLKRLDARQDEDGSQHDEIDRLRFTLEQSDYEVQQLQSKLERCKNLLGELFAMVDGECPSLLSEDSGGDAELGLQIEEALSDG